MSEDAELERLRRRRAAEMLRRLQARESEEAKRRGREERRETEDPKEVLGKVLVGRAWEVLKAAENQYPDATRRIEKNLANLVSTGKLKSPVNGGQLLWFFRHLGINVRVKTHIYVSEHGKLKTIGEKLREA